MSASRAIPVYVIHSQGTLAILDEALLRDLLIKMIQQTTEAAKQPGLSEFEVGLTDGAITAVRSALLHLDRCIIGRIVSTGGTTDGVHSGDT